MAIITPYLTTDSSHLLPDLFQSTIIAWLMPIKLTTWLLKGVQWLNIYYFIQFTDTILGIVVFVQKYLDLIFTLFLSFWKLKIRRWKICYGSTRSLSWLCEDSVMALRAFRHGSARSPSWLCEDSVMALREVRQGGILPVEADASLHRWWIPSRAMTDFSQSHDGFLTDPQFHKASVTLWMN